MVRILYLAPGPAPLESEPERNKFFYLSKYFSGDILHPIWGIKGPKAKSRINAIKKASGNFNYHYTFSFHLPKPIRFINDLLFYIIKGVKIYYFHRKYDIIITYGPFKTGIAGYLIKIITGKKLIVEIPGNPVKSFLFQEKKKNKINIVKSKGGSLITKFLLKNCDHIKLLYPQQVRALKYNENGKISVFSNFVPTKILKPSEIDENFILFLGFPWYLKGVDILIKAFKKIYNNFPEYKLKIVGFCPDKTYFNNLKKNCHAIELLNPVNHEVAMDLMGRCSIFVLPSRTEAMGRVLLEAMAVKKPIIASAVDGIPHYIKHNHNGLLFKSENINELAENISILLKNRQKRIRLAENGYTCVKRFYTEEKFTNNFKFMVENLVHS